MQRARKPILLFTASNLLMLMSVAHLSAVALMAQTSTTPQSDRQVETAKGSQTVSQVCVACHTNILKMVQIHKQSAEQWRDTVYSMIGRGAQLRPEEIEPVIAFLAANSATNRERATDATTRGRSDSGNTEQQPSGGEGRAVLQRNCQTCHDLATASTKSVSEDWNAVVEKMMSYGARLTPGDKQKLVAYLNSIAK